LPPALDTWHIGLPKKDTRTPAAEAKRHNSHGGKINGWPVTAHWGSNGEVEGPDDYAGQAPRAHTVPRRPRRQTDHASRPPPTVVRRPLRESLHIQALAPHRDGAVREKPDVPGVAHKSASNV